MGTAYISDTRHLVFADTLDHTVAAWMERAAARTFKGARNAAFNCYQPVLGFTSDLRNCL